VVIFTKYDKLIRSRKRELQEGKFSQDQAVLNKESRKEAQVLLNKCATSLRHTVQTTPELPYVKMSCNDFLFFLQSVLSADLSPQAIRPIVTKSTSRVKSSLLVTFSVTGPDHADERHETGGVL
jgi:hypothetical protein